MPVLSSIKNIETRATKRKSILIETPKSLNLSKIPPLMTLNQPYKIIAIQRIYFHTSILG